MRERETSYLIWRPARSLSTTTSPMMMMMMTDYMVLGEFFVLLYKWLPSTTQRARRTVSFIRFRRLSRVPFVRRTGKVPIRWAKSGTTTVPLLNAPQPVLEVFVWKWNAQKAKSPSAKKTPQILLSGCRNGSVCVYACVCVVYPHSRHVFRIPE